MQRGFLGLIAATLAAPYITVALVFAVLLVSGEARLIEIWSVLTLGTTALVVFGIPILLVSSFLAILVGYGDKYKHLAAPLAGALAGGGFFTTISWSNLHHSHSRITILCGALSGAICGWIYWRIAIGRKPQAPVSAVPE